MKETMRSMTPWSSPPHVEHSYMRLSSFEERICLYILLNTRFRITRLHPSSQQKTCKIKLVIYAGRHSIIVFSCSTDPEIAVAHPNIWILSPSRHYIAVVAWNHLQIPQYNCSSPCQFSLKATLSGNNLFKVSTNSVTICASVFWFARLASSPHT